MLNSGRPAAPKLAWALPAFTWSGTGTANDPHTKKGGSVRLYLERPWWSSGDDEQLAVVCWPVPFGLAGQMPKAYEPYATQWGTDPVHLSSPASGYPRPSNFPLAVGTPVDQPLPEIGGDPVAIAPHAVSFDAERDLWFCDVDVSLGEGAVSYNPFIRLALARYQPHSLPGVALSPVVLADFVQLGNDRALSAVTTATDRRTFTLAGRTSVQSAGGGPNQARFRVETQPAGISDPDLGWSTYRVRVGRSIVAQEATVDPSIVNGDLGFWSVELRVPSSGKRRVIVEEIETFYDGFTGNDNGPILTRGTRIAHIDTLPIT